MVLQSLASKLNALKRPLHTKSHGDHKFDLCPTCLAAIDSRSVEVEFPPFGKLVLGNLGTGRHSMSNRRLTFFERLSIDTEVKRNDTEHSYINSTQVNLILDFLGIKNESSDLATFKYDYDRSASHIVSVDDLQTEKYHKDDLLLDINLQYNMLKIRFSDEAENEERRRRSTTSKAFGEMYLKTLEKYGMETKEKRRQETMLAIKQVLQPANDPIIYAPFFDKKPTHNVKNRLRIQQKKNEIQYRIPASNKVSNEQSSLDDGLFDVY